MATSLDYALLAGSAYLSTRNEINQFPTPMGWTEGTAFRKNDGQTGFEALVFQRGNEIVISYSGTDRRI